MLKSILDPVPMTSLRLTVTADITLKMRILVLTLCAVAVAADVAVNSAKSQQDAKILSQELDIGVEGNYQWSFQSDNGISARENGALDNPNSEDAAQVSQGEAQYTAPDGQVIKIQYLADRNGYQPQGDHIPTPPPIPPYVIKALEYIRAHPPTPEKN